MRAGVCFSAFQVFGLGTSIENDLSFCPCFGVYDGFAVVFYDQFGKFERAFVDGALKECAVRVDGFVETGFFSDLVQAATGDEHLVGFADARGIFFFGYPAVIGAGFACTMIDGFDGNALDANGGNAGNSALLNNGAESVF